ncbi:hypothetical protein D3C72_1429530 [compost metagenome]
MQVWPAFISLPTRMRSTARGRSAPAPTMAGDLPPSSSVTGVRLAAAARITWWPTAVEPVNSRWSKGSAVKALATSASPLTTMISSGAKCCGTSCANKAAKRGVYSDSFTMARLPAASAPASGPTVRYSG